MDSMAKPDEAAAARDTSNQTVARDTTRDSTLQNPPGYRGMERDTTAVPPGAASQPVDTFLQRQGTGAPQDTMGYGGLEKDTTGQQQTRETETPSDTPAHVPGWPIRTQPAGWVEWTRPTTWAGWTRPRPIRRTPAADASGTGTTTPRTAVTVRGVVRTRPTYFSIVFAIVCSCMLLVPS